MPLGAEVEEKIYQAFFVVTKGQLVSGWLFDVLNFQKRNEKIWWTSALESRDIGYIGKIKALLYINHVK